MKRIFSNKYLRTLALLLLLASLACQTTGLVPAPATPTQVPAATEAPVAATEAPAAEDVATEAPVAGPPCPVLDGYVPEGYIALGADDELKTEDTAVVVTTTYTGCESVTSVISIGTGNYTVAESTEKNIDGNWEVVQIFVKPEVDGVHPPDREIGKVACRIGKYILTAPDRSIVTTKSSQIFFLPDQRKRLPENCETYNAP